MRKETLMFVIPAFLSIYFFTIVSVIGLFAFGLTWLCFGDD